MVNVRTALVGLTVTLLGGGCSVVLGLEDYGNAAAGVEGAPDAMAPEGAAREASREAEGPDAPRSSKDTSVADSPPDHADVGQDVDAGESCSSVLGFACTPLPPPGWTGPLAIFEGSGSILPSLPPCSGSFATDDYDGFDAPTATASTCTCSCGAPSGAACQGSVSFSQNGSCSKSCGAPATLPQGACTPVNTSGCSGGGPVVSVSASASGGACAPTPSTTIPTAAWTKEVRACGLSSTPIAATCETGEACVPVPSLPYEAGNLCVSQVGNVACPASFPKQRIYYESSTDTRGCSACSCAEPTEVVCAGGTVNSYFDSSCGFLVNSSAFPQSCETRSGATASMDLTGVTASGGTCAPSAVTPTGDVSPEQPLTICCLQ
jgi:hypothetical protein